MRRLSEDKIICPFPMKSVKYVFTTLHRENYFLVTIACSEDLRSIVHKGAALIMIFLGCKMLTDLTSINKMWEMLSLRIAEQVHRNA